MQKKPQKVARETPASEHLAKQLGETVSLDIQTWGGGGGGGVRRMWVNSLPSLLDGEEGEACKKQRFGIYETLKKWMEFTTLLIQYISPQWAVNPAFSSIWWSALAASDVDEWCNSIIYSFFLSTFFLGWILLLQSANGFLLALDSICTPNNAAFTRQGDK